MHRKQKTIFIRFETTGLGMDVNIKEYKFLRFVSYSPHPSVGDMHQLLTTIKPQCIYPIVPDAYVDISEDGRFRFPTVLTDLCQDMQKFKKTNSYDYAVPGTIEEPWIPVKDEPKNKKRASAQADEHIGSPPKRSKTFLSISSHSDGDDGR